MTGRPRSILLLATLMLAAIPALADSLLVNVNGYTWSADGALQRFGALRFDADGAVTATYAAGQHPADTGAAMLDGGGRTLIPGLIDAHGHVLNLGLLRSRVDLTGSKSLSEALQRIAAYARQHPDVPWILGRGWNQELWPERKFPNAGDLDQLQLGRPIWLQRIDGHAAWADSLAMKTAGITKRTPDPHGGRILRDSRRRATGIFIDNAEALVDAAVPAPTPAQQRKALQVALQQLASVGLTGVHDAGIDLSTARLYRKMAAAGELPIRVYAMLSEQVSEGFGAPLVDDGRGFLTIRSIKVYLDGALGSRGAALLAPYSDANDNTGLLFRQTDKFAGLVIAAQERGFQVNVHAIGDAANRVALDGFAAAPAATALRHRIEHAQVIALSDIPRFAGLGIIASVQPTHATSDKNMAEDRVGSKRILGSYAWRRLLDAGARIAAGSDFPVEPEQPLYGLHAAVTRQDRDDQPPGGWYKEQALTLEEALRAFTLDAAYAAHQEQHLGSLEPGKRADFVLLDRDIFALPAAQIWQARVSETWVNGVCIYQAPN
ncbi:MAG: amidohydrolase [Gammaproteobacteria bacterium]|nr:amidohydrolase [Gammaproteobacteria bacterium]NNF61861.1 amidohydrolase [Gammaproteobacteria bacterium]